MKLGGRQLAVMRVLWEYDEATVAEVQERMGVDPPLAYSTVATVLSRMEQKGLISHRVEDRQYVYRPLLTRDGAGQSMVSEMVDRLFGGSPAALVNQLLDSEQVDREELERIKRLVREHEAKTRGSQ